MSETLVEIESIEVLADSFLRRATAAASGPNPRSTPRFIPGWPDRSVTFFPRALIALEAGGSEL